MTRDYDINTVAEVIEGLGGTLAVIAMTGRSPQAITNWKAEKRIASYLFFIMSCELERRGHCADPRLWGMQIARADAMEDAA